MNKRRFIAFIISFVMLLSSLSLTASALPLEAGLEKLQTQFAFGCGPETDGITIDYRYFEPQGDGKYPLVIWLHGKDEGAYEGKQVVNNNIAYWISDEFQSRFTDADGAFIFAPRAPEDKGIFWGNSTVYPLRAAVDEFIEANYDKIDISRIYIGGFSMGGMMTLKMCIAYPDMFAAAFPICPAWAPTTEDIAYMADIPVWLTSAVYDPLVSYKNSVVPTWNKIIETNLNPELCRFSTLEFVTYPDGRPTSSSHHSWFAVNYDMFSIENGDYQFMSTVNGVGEEVKLTYPNGMISWLSQFSSDFDSEKATDSGNIDPDASVYNGVSFLTILDNIIEIVKDVILKLMAIVEKLEALPQMIG